MTTVPTRDELATLIARNDKRKHRRDRCEEDDYGCLTLDVSHYADDACARDIDLLFGHIAALEAAAIPHVSTDGRVRIRALRASIVIDQAGPNRWTIGIPTERGTVALWLHAKTRIHYRLRTLPAAFPHGAPLIAHVPIAGLRFGQLIVNPLRRATTKTDLQQRLFYITNEELQWHIESLLKELST
jgi:hypothetical protein